METPKKSTSDRGKELCNDPTERNSLQNNKTSTELPKITLDVDQKSEIALTKAEQDSSFNLYLKRNEGRSKGESSKPFALPLHLSGTSSRRPIMCKFCGQTFASTQALGGHQNAHKQERELQKALKAARDFRNNPFLCDYNLPRETLAQFPGSNFGRHRFGYHPYPGYAQRAFQGFQAKPVYSHHVIGLLQGPPALGQALERFKPPVGTAFNPGWPTPYQYSPRVAPIRRFNAPTNFNAVGERNMTALMQAMGNDASIPQNYNIEPSKTDSLPNCNESLKLKSPMNQNESAELDLNLKL